MLLLQRLKLVNACQHVSLEREVKPGIVAIVGSNGCLGGEQKVYDPVKQVALPVSEIRESFHVYARDASGAVVVAEADCPYQKGVDDLYAVELSNGERFVATLDHRVLAPTGWQKLKDLPVGSAILAKAGPNAAIKIARFLRKDAFYDFGVPVHHNYELAGVWHHNSGKTNLMHLIRASITNTYGPMAGKKADNINRLAASDEPSYVETQWRVAAGTMLIRRSFRNADAGLWLNNERLVGAKNDDITAKALELSGVKQQVFDDFLFANFTQITCVANGTRDARVSLIQPLCGLERLPLIDRYLRDSVNVNTALVEAFDPKELDEQASQWGQLRLAIKKAAAKLQEFDKKLPSAKYVSQQRKLLREYEDRKEQRQQLTLASDRKRKLVAERKSLETTAAEAEQKVADARIATTAAKEAVDKHLADVKLHSEYKAYQQRLDSLIEVIDEPPPKEPVKDESISCSAAELNAKCEYLMNQIKGVDKAIRNAKEGTTFDCQTCRNPVNVTQAYRHKLQQERQSLMLEFKEQQSVADAAAEYESQMASWKLAIAWHEKSVKAAQLEMDALARPVGGETPPVGDIDLLNSKLADLKAVERSADRAAREVSDKLVAISARCKAASEDIARRKQQLGEQVSSLTSQQLAEIRQLLLAYDEASQQRQTISEELANLRGKAAATVKQLRKLRADRRKICERAKWLDTLKRSRDVIKRDRLPARVIAVMLRRTTSKLNEYLVKLGVPFTAIADPDQFSFTIRHQDGTKEAANRLSTGQSLCLGVAFWLARSDVFAGQLPMFWFDEPVANLDAERKVQVAELFGKLGQELAKNGRQGIVITHDDAIIKTATEVIRL